MTDGKPGIVSIIPYRVLPAKLGGEKGIAVFNEYLAREVRLTGISTRNNDPALAKGYRLMNILSNSRLRYANIFLYFTVKKILRKERATHLLIEHPYFGWLAWMLKKTMPVKLTVHSHNIEYMRSKSIGRWWWKLLHAYEGWVYRQADNVFFISDDDRVHAIEKLRVSPSSCITVTYGTEQAAPASDREACRRKVMEMHGIQNEERILMFNGALYHPTNYDALRVILDQINPLVMQQAGFRYKILVCGKGLPDSFDELRPYRDRNIIYAGFVEDISIYFRAADVFLNPILTGGGVKTKAIEGLAFGCSVVSTELGAMGIRRDLCGGKLHVVREGEWSKFARLVISADTESRLPDSFYEYYYWGNVVKRAVDFIKDNNA